MKKQAYRLIVAGCRDFCDYPTAAAALQRYIEALGAGVEVIIVSGGARGADALGERFAAEHGLTVERFPAEWARYGRAAGPKRNAQMAEAADGALIFWDGTSKGTHNMIECARRAGKPLALVQIGEV